MANTDLDKARRAPSEWAGKHAFIVGQGGRWGTALAEALLGAGARVSSGQADAALEAALSRAEQHLGRVELICFVAADPAAASVCATLDEWDAAFARTLEPLMATIRCALPRLAAQPAAQFLVALPLLGFLPDGRFGPDSVVQRAAVGLVESLRAELDPEGGRISLLLLPATRSSAPDQGTSEHELGKEVLEGLTRNRLYIIPGRNPGLRAAFGEYFRGIEECVGRAGIGGPLPEIPMGMVYRRA
jgi:NAD(P)-dependent dehydrogenase (short-subunit alcohol dehydrogenase family)